MRRLARDNECRGQRPAQAVGHVLRADCRGAKASQAPSDGPGLREGTSGAVRTGIYLILSSQNSCWLHFFQCELIQSVSIGSIAGSTSAGSFA